MAQCLEYSNLFTYLNLLITGCPLNSNQKNDKKMTNFLVKNEKKYEENVPKNSKKTLWMPRWKQTSIQT